MRIINKLLLGERVKWITLGLIRSVGVVFGPSSLSEVGLLRQIMEIWGQERGIEVLTHTISLKIGFQDQWLGKETLVLVVGGSICRKIIN